MGNTPKQLERWAASRLVNREGKLIMDVLFICYELLPSATEADEAKAIGIIESLFPTHWHHSARTWIVLPDRELDYYYDQLSHYLGERRALCQAYSKATEEMTTIVRDALASKKRPTDGYLFYLWNAPDDLHECDSSLLSSVNDCELAVGLFSRLEICQQVEAAVRSAGEGTRQCRNWNTEKFYQSDRHH